ncbi:MAG TPA: hypothetical protein PLT92_14980, partial [Ignavibacteriaceae bacterium]|nr:hypothetical protein [Ignavibacteriaceae bacterium]
MIMKVSELTLFGGLAKMQIPKGTKSGVLKGLDTHYLLTMRSYKVTLKICKKKKVYDEFDKIYFDDIVKEEIIELDNENPFNKVKVVEDWKKTIWDYAFIRSLEI